MRSQDWAAALLVGIPLVAGQRRYADFQAPLEQDDDVVAANFPDVEDIELLSPAFLDPESVPEGFSNGTSSATLQVDQGQ